MKRTTWIPGDYPRDTMVHALGVLADSVLREAMEDGTVRDRYERWVPRARPPQLQLLVTTGDERGTLSLLARAARDEFCLRIEHADFQALVPVGFDFARGRLEGVFVATFEGSILAAIEFARSLTCALRHTRRELRIAN